MSTRQRPRRRLIKGLIPLLAAAGSVVGVSAGEAAAFTPGTGCGTGTGSSSGITASAGFVALPPCTGYIRVVNNCQAFNGTKQYQYGPIRTWPNTSSRTCSSPYNAALASWGWQVSGTP